MFRYQQHCQYFVPYNIRHNDSSRFINVFTVIITFLLLLLPSSFNIIETSIITISTSPFLHVVTAFTSFPNSFVSTTSSTTTRQKRQQQQEKQQRQLLFVGQQKYTTQQQQQSSSQGSFVTVNTVSNSFTTELDSTSTTSTSTSTTNNNNFNKYLSANQQELTKNIPLVSQYPRTWVPMGSIYELDPNRPTEVEFLGISYVIYRGSISTSTSTSNNAELNKETWIVADNTCPHRLAPLSEGRIITQVDTSTNTSTSSNTITNSLLQCSYHGWTFNNNGTCVSIPQASDTIVESNAFKNKLCHIPIYPTIIHKDIIWAWIWPESIIEITSQIIIQNNFTTTSTSSTIDNDSNNYNYNTNNIIEQLLGNPYWMLQRVPDTNITTYTRELPYGWDTLLENIVDPSHVPFAHHGLQGTRNDATAITMSIDKFQKFITNTMYGVSTSDGTTMSVTVADSSEDTNDDSTTITRTTPKQQQQHNTNNKQQQEQRLFQTGFDYNFIDRTMTMKRNCTGVFRAPYLIQYEGEYYANDTDRTFNLSVLMIPTKPGWSRVTIFGSTIFGKSNSDNTDDDDDELLSINATATDTNNVDKGMIKVPNNKKTTTLQTKQKKKKNKFSIFSILMRILPIWVIHQFSNRFLDSDLAFLHYQEQERRRRKRISYNYNSGNDDGTISTTISTPNSGVETSDTNSKNNNNKLLYDIRNYYFVPAQADRGITTIRRWVRQYANYIIDVEQDLVPERIYDRSILFNRYIQHTDKCKHCSKAYHTTIPLYKKYCYRTLYTSIVLLCTIIGSNKLLLLPRIALSLATIGSIFTLRLLSIAEQLLTKGYDFKHYEND